MFVGVQGDAWDSWLFWVLHLFRVIVLAPGFRCSSSVKNCRTSKQEVAISETSAVFSIFTFSNGQLSTRQFCLVPRDSCMLPANSCPQFTWRFQWQNVWAKHPVLTILYRSKKCLGFLKNCAKSILPCGEILHKAKFVFVLGFLPVCLSLPISPIPLFLPCSLPLMIGPSLQEFVFSESFTLYLQNCGRYHDNLMGM